MDPHALARSLAIEIKHTASRRPLSIEDQEAIREAAAQMVELLSETQREQPQQRQPPHQVRKRGQSG